MDILSPTIASLRLVSLALGAVFGGYTLMPIPRILENLFKNYQMFKLLVLTVIMINTMGQLTIVNVLVALAIATVTLALFEFLRTL